jgi:nucleoside-diphosphate-sugar epimerase
MKILVTGATGRIGSRVVAHCLARPEITCIVALSRRELEYKDKKLITVIVKDFLNLPEDVLREHGDAECMLWYVALTGRTVQVWVETAQLTCNEQVYGCTYLQY